MRLQVRVLIDSTSTVVYSAAQHHVEWVYNDLRQYLWSIIWASVAFTTGSYAADTLHPRCTLYEQIKLCIVPAAIESPVFLQILIHDALSKESRQ